MILCGEILQVLSSSFLAESVAGPGNAVLTALWASSLSTSSVTLGQPYPARVVPARANAVATIEGIPRWAELPTLANWHVKLSSQDFGSVVPEGELEILYREIFDFVVDHDDLSPGEIAIWAGELAAIMLEQDRWGSALNRDLRRLLDVERRTPGAASSEIDRLLLCDKSRFLVIVGLSGAEELSGLESVVRANTRVLKDAITAPSFSGWGGAGGSASEFVDFLMHEPPRFREHPLHSTVNICLEVVIDAVGTEAAGAEARRVALRLVDEISASHPVARVRVGEVVGVGEPVRGRFEAHRFAPRDSRSVRVEGARTQPPLSESVRAAAIIRNLEDPLTRAAFSWIAMETAGFEKNSLEKCGKALAMHCLRQEAILAYRDLVRGVGVLSQEVRMWERAARVSKRRLARLEKRRPTRPEDVRRVEALLAAEESSLQELEERHRVALERFTVAEDLVNGLGVAELGSTFGMKGFSHVHAMAVWQQELAALAPDGDLGMLMDLIPARHGAGARAMHAILSDVAGIQSWLEVTATYYWRLLDGIYSARNVHLHSGVSDVPGSIVLGRVAPMVVDAIVEMCLLWQRAGRQESPSELIEEVSSRFDTALAVAAQSSIVLNDVTSP